MKIEFVNHSSFIVEYNSIRIICDPWLEGSVFNNGWDLIAPTKFAYEDFQNIQYIWFSHEHPDHFFPPNIKKIPPTCRQQIVVLFQATDDKRVVDWCRKQGFKDVIELKPNQWLSLAPQFEVLCEHFDEGDSWICFRSDRHVYLNTNDCGIRNKNQALRLKLKVKKVDLLLTQFSYAYWAGNPDQRAYRKKIADEKLEWMKFQCDIFEAPYIIPIASYIYFSHEENHYLNDEINTARKTYDYLKANTRTEPVILYNGEIWTYGTPHDSEGAIEKYRLDLERAGQNLHHAIHTISKEEMQKQAEKFLGELKKNNRFYLKSFLKETNLYVRDYQQAYNMSLSAFKITDLTEEKCDISLTSENLSFCFQHSYGLDTTQINGRLRKPAGGNYPAFYNYFRINQLKSRGIDPNSLTYLLLMAGRKVFGILGLYKN
jgi:hypothetical protein